jgi:hypothetical protein
MLGSVRGVPSRRVSRYAETDVRLFRSVRGEVGAYRHCRGCCAVACEVEGERSTPGKHGHTSLLWGQMLCGSRLRVYHGLAWFEGVGRRYRHRESE